MTAKNDANEAIYGEDIKATGPVFSKARAQRLRVSRYLGVKWDGEMWTAACSVHLS